MDGELTAMKAATRWQLSSRSLGGTRKCMAPEGRNGIKKMKGNKAIRTKERKKEIKKDGRKKYEG
jgi:hypothetical protein